MAGRPRLRRLARALGVLDGYDEAGTGRWRATSDTAREGIVQALGFEARDEASARRSLEALRDASTARLMEPVSVETAGTPGARRARLHLPTRAGRRTEVHLTLAPEDGPPLEWTLARQVRADGVLAVPLPVAPEPGHYTLRAELAGGTGPHAVQARIVAPARCVAPREKLGRRRAFGLWANLYSVRSRRGAGAGDLGDLRRLVAWAEREGAAFVGVNPLHALWNHPPDTSPYSPVSRLYRSVLYLDVAAVPEAGEAPGEARAGWPSRESDAIDYAGVAMAKLAALRRLHARFAARHRDRPSPRGRAYARFVAREGEALERFATFLAVASVRRGDGPHAPDWRRWPAEWRDPGSAVVRRFAAAHADEIDFHRFVQFELDRQLAATARAGRALPVGLYTDLAIGSGPASADAWSFPDLFASGARLGAPPDVFATAGQDWGILPLHPGRLREDGYRFFARLLRAGFAHGGALRIDHVMGLSRQWWIPEGAPASTGAYLRQPERELLAVLALESRRAGALVIGEDLGTVPRGLSSRLARRGVLSSRVLLFERDGERFRPASRYSPRALVTANTHDLPPLASWLSGRDLALRRKVGQIPDDATLERERAARRADLRALLRRLVRDGLWRAGAEPTPGALAAAVTAFLCRTPSPLVGLALDDLAGEDEPVNLPGVPPEQHASWTRRMTVALEDLPRHPVARAALDAVPAWRRTPRRPTRKR